jgi:hypothetical protein
MGLELYDVWSLGHFSMGFMSHYLFQTTGMNIFLNFFIANSLHLLIELLEKDVRYGKIVENNKNHITDIIFFFWGWCLSYITNSSRYIPHYLQSILWTMLGFTFLKEILIEIYIEQSVQINTLHTILIICLIILSFIRILQ